VIWGNAKEIDDYLYFAGMWGGQAALDKANINAIFELLNLELLEQLRDRRNYLITSVDTTTKEWLANRIVSEQSKGHSVAEVTKTLRSEVGEMAKLRARKIVETETINAMGVVELETLKRNHSDKKRWITSRDERVCFPAWTLVQTNDGVMPIQKITPGMKVLTRHGVKNVIRTSKRLYRGCMVNIKTKNESVIATQKHPFMVDSKWLECGKIKGGQLLEKVNKKKTPVLSVEKFLVGKPTHFPSLFLKIFRFPFVAISSILMPIYAVCFNSNTKTRKKKVNTISTNFGFLDIFKVQHFKHFSHRLFKAIFSPVLSRTTQATKNRVIRRSKSKSFITMFTNPILRWSTTFFRAIMSIKSFFGSKNFTTSFARNIFSIGGSTRPTTNSISIGKRFPNSKLLITNWTNFTHIFINQCPLPPTISTTKQLSSTRRKNIKSLRTLFATNILTKTLTLWGSKLHFRISNRHISRCLTNMNILYHKMLAKSIYVYNLEIESLPEFYANGILVHNCPICNGNTAQGFININENFSSGQLAPPAHVFCRCFMEGTIPKDIPLDVVWTGK